VKITKVITTPLYIPYIRPYYWSDGVVNGASILLVEVHTDSGVVGIGESIASPSVEAMEAYLKAAAKICIGQEVFRNAELISEVDRVLFKSLGTGSSPRLSGQVLAGLEMALWDAMGKAVARPVYDLFGGAINTEIRYFGFAQGQTAVEVAEDARRLSEDGFEVIYVKAGRGDELDFQTISMVRKLIGPNKRLRVDPNESWTPLHASRMLRRLSAFDIEVVEQPTHCESIAALAQVRSNSPVAISADQSVFTPFDAYTVCSQSAADLIVIGLHEAGGLLRWLKVAHIAEAAGINVCIHGLFETGITACASMQVAAVVPNLDDGNQHMTRFLQWDIVKSPSLDPVQGSLAIPQLPGLGIEVDWDAVERSKHAYSSIS
jgi:L-alanine-DL-glutamate epimerase-like enolase superfamily enzyme